MLAQGIAHLDHAAFQPQQLGGRQQPRPETGKRRHGQLREGDPGKGKGRGCQPRDHHQGQKYLVAQARDKDRQSRAGQREQQIDRADRQDGGLHGEVAARSQQACLEAAQHPHKQGRRTDTAPDPRHGGPFRAQAVQGADAVQQGGQLQQDGQEGVDKKNLVIGRGIAQ